MTSAAKHLQATELYFASLIATAIVYAAGMLIFSALSFFGQQTGGWGAVFSTLMFAIFVGTIAATAIALLITGPLGTGIGLAIVRFTPAGKWQGPVTGALVAIVLEAFTVLVVAQERMEWEGGNAVMLAIPIILAMIAGAIVQQRVLRWPE
ncbi:hypothetical protein ACRAQ6_04890 [Erythrobacter sp. HA6-11]